MDKPQEIVGAHSAIEAYLHLLITPCSLCGHGACAPAAAERADEGAAKFHVTCGNCGAVESFLVRDMPLATPVDPLSLAAPLNPTREPSGLIDVAQWLTAAELMMQSAKATPDSREAWWLRRRAAECLDEALKFYRPDSELPPESAFWVRSSRTALKEHPQRFARERVIAMRADLPRAIKAQDTPEARGFHGRRRPWWRPW